MMKLKPLELFLYGHIMNSQRLEAIACVAKVWMLGAITL